MDKYTRILYRMPEVLRQLLYGLPESLPETYRKQIHSIVEHLVLGEMDDWMTKIKHLVNSDSHTYRESTVNLDLTDRSIMELIDNFQVLRDQNLRELEQINLQQDDLNRSALHPQFGELSIRQLLSLWTTHDLFHIDKIFLLLMDSFQDEVSNVRERYFQ